ncbi:hypothetical protein [Jiulongibacter sediminis]|uniref:hypothetical protein n=1 Tax=Jiulongibacter sediminis TaxID=1605367 RepID=UPI0026EE4C6B|nr:hypothetical protein [Jiulongibacter sediminis]
MKRIIKATLLFICIIINTEINAQEQVITTTGSGPSYDIARNNALRYAIESAFGTFISSETKISNDILQSDEIYAISTGNVSNIKELSKIQIGDNYSVTLKVTVSPSKLVSFVQSKGMNVEFNGEAFASKIKTTFLVEKLNEQSEPYIINTFVDYANLVLPQCFDYEVEASEPYLSRLGDWIVQLDLNVNANANFSTLINYLNNNLRNVSMSGEAISQRQSIGRESFVLVFNGQKHYFRTKQSIMSLWNFFSRNLFQEITKNKILMDAGPNSKTISIQNVTIEPQTNICCGNYQFTTEFTTQKIKFKFFSVTNDKSGVFSSVTLKCPPTEYHPNGCNETIISVTTPKPFVHGEKYETFPNNETGVNIIGNLKGFRILK